MKKVLLTVAAIALSGVLHAQQRMALYEEFSGENCAPCAAYNPALWSRISANPTKVLLIKYQSPIPSAGPIYNAYRTVTDARRIYYGINSAPSGQLDGNVLSGHINNLSQSIIDNEALVAAPFTITAAHQWIAGGDSVSTTVTVTAPSGFTPRSANLKLRMALIEHLQYDTAPGTNGETEFHNVVREMYPNAGGTPLNNSWPVGQSQTITIKGRVPSYVNKSGETRVVVWLQDDLTKNVLQSVSTIYQPLAIDMASTALSAGTPQSLVCTAGSASVNPVVTLRNTGSATVSSATIYYRLDATTWQTYNWTGSLAAQATANVTLPALSVAPGTHIIADSVARPNGLADLNGGNNKATTSVSIHSTAGLPLPIAAGFENAGGVPANWLLYDANANAQNWAVQGSATTSTGHNASRYMLYFDAYDYPAGEVDYAILPADNLASGSTKFLDFYVAYAQYAAIYSERLDVVYSMDCGTTWTSAWNMAGSALATAPITTSPFVPSQSQWAAYTVDLSTIPANAMIALRATSAFGNNLYIDDVTLRTTNATATTSAVAQSATLAPNPANTQSVLAFTLAKTSAVRVEVVDALGRTVATPAVDNLSASQRQVTINTADLAAGVYNVVVRTADGSFTKRLSVVR